MKVCLIKKVKDFRDDKNRKLIYIVVFSFTVAILLISLSFHLVTNAANEVRNIMDLAVSNDLENLKKYELNYELIVYSNKTINRYTAYESYIKQNDIDETFKFSIINEVGIDLNYEISNNMLKIYSSNQINEYVINDYDISKINLYSLSTFFDIYYEIKNSGCTCNNRIYSKEEGEVIEFGILFDKNVCQYETSILNYNKILSEEGIHIEKLSMFVDKNTKNPIKYIAYGLKNGEEKALFEINYSMVKFN